MIHNIHRRLAWLLWLMCLFLPSTLFAQGPLEDAPSITEWKESHYTSEQPLPFLPTAADENLLAEDAPQPLAPDNGVAPFSILAWQSVQTNNWDIRAAVESEGAVYRITRESTSDVNPAVRPGTYEVGYTRIESNGNSDIYRVQATGSEPSPLITSSASDNYPTYSGDGQLLYFASTRHGNWELYRANADGGDIVRITDNPLPDVMPNVSRDGTMITWVRQVNQSQGVIMRANGDGSNAVALTNPITFLQHPKFSPDGTRIGFDGDVHGNNTWNDIAYLNLATNTITTNPNALGYNNIDYWFSGWSPTVANEIIYTRVVYVFIQGNLYIQEARVYNELTGQQNPRQMFADALAMNGAWERTEVIVPTVSMAPLPDYSKALGFTVALTGADAGPAPIGYYEMQLNNGSGWAFYKNSLSPHVGVVQPTGADFQVRAMAVDVAGNRSVFTTPESTQLYTAEMSVTATDVLGNPQPNTQFAIVPFPLTTETLSVASVKVRHDSTGSVTVRPTAPNFGQLPQATLNGLSDSTFTTYFPGTDNRLLNGGFSEELTNWLAGGSVPPMLSTGGHGDNSAAWFCDWEPCWAENRNTGSTGNFGITVDSQDKVHLVYAACCSDVLYYQTYTEAEGWSEEVATFEPINVHSIRSVRLNAAPDGTLHMVYWDEGRVRYNRRLPNGTWSATEIVYTPPIGYGTVHDSTVDDNGVLHLIYARSIPANPAFTVEYIYRQRAVDGTWSGEEWITSHTANTTNGLSARLLTLPDGTVHSWIQSSGHFVRHPGQAWRLQFTSSDPANPLFTGSTVQQWFSAPDGTIHAIWKRAEVYGHNTRFMYGEYSPATGQWGAWSPLVVAGSILNGTTSAAMVRNGDGTILMLTTAARSLLQQTRTPDGVWSQIGEWKAYPTLYGGDQIDFTAAGDIRLVGAYGVYYQNAPELPQTSTLHQVVDLDGMTRPTLGFVYRFEHAWRESDATLTISVTNGITATELFHTYANPNQQDWTLGSADLSLYTGETVTVTFAYHQPAGQPWSNLMLDDVTLSSYRAPVLLSATPAVIESDWVGEVITVTGQNFIAPLSVSMNNIPVTVTRIDDTTFTFAIPANARVGVQQISVTNGEGLNSRRGLLRLGQGLFLSIVDR